MHILHIFPDILYMLYTKMVAKDCIWNYNEKAIICHGFLSLKLWQSCWRWSKFGIRISTLHVITWGIALGPRFCCPGEEGYGEQILLKSVLLEYHNPCLQILKRIGRVQVPFQFLSCFFFTVYSLPVITKAWTLVDWCGIYSLNTTNSSILVPKTLPDMVFCLPDPSLPGRKGLRSRQGLYEDSLMWTIYPLYL